MNVFWVQTESWYVCVCRKTEPKLGAWRKVEYKFFHSRLQCHTVMGQTCHSSLYCYYVLSNPEDTLTILLSFSSCWILRDVSTSNRPKLSKNTTTHRQIVCKKTHLSKNQLYLAHISTWAANNSPPCGSSNNCSIVHSHP